MNPPKYTAIEYINFLIGTQKAYSCSEAERVQPTTEPAVAHDAINRLLHRLEPSPNELWQEARSYVSLELGILVIDDTMLDKWYAKHMDLVSRQWSGKHKRVVQGINLTSLVWSDGDKHIPCDYRLYEKEVDGATKNSHFRAMLATAKDRGFQPRCVAFDSWLTRLKRNRLVNSDKTRNRPICEVAVASTGTVVHAHWLWVHSSIQDCCPRR